MAGEPLRTHETRVPADWVDYNGHTNDSRYAQLSCDASDALLRLIGLDAEYLSTGHSWFTAESHITYVAQSRAGDPVHVTTQVLAHDPKRLHVFNRMYRTSRDGEPDVLIATGEHLYLHVDTAAERVGAGSAGDGRPDRGDRGTPRRARPAGSGRTFRRRPAQLTGHLKLVRSEDASSSCSRVDFVLQRVT